MFMIDSACLHYVLSNHRKAYRVFLLFPLQINVSNNFNALLAAALGFILAGQVFRVCGQAHSTGCCPYLYIKHSPTTSSVKVSGYPAVYSPFNDVKVNLLLIPIEWPYSKAVADQIQRNNYCLEKVDFLRTTFISSMK